MTSNGREIFAAALRWHSAHVRRLEIGAEKRRWDVAAKLDDNVFSRARAASSAAATRLTPAKRVQLAALRALAKACAKERGGCYQIEDATLIIDVQSLRLF